MSRHCFWVDPAQDSRKDRFYASVVTEHEAGHVVIRAMPFGDTIEQAEDRAILLNMLMGLSREDIDEIIVSSMRASNMNKQIGRLEKLLKRALEAGEEALPDGMFEPEVWQDIREELGIAE